MRQTKRLTQKDAQIIVAYNEHKSVPRVGKMLHRKESTIREALTRWGYKYRGSVWVVDVDDVGVTNTISNNRIYRDYLTKEFLIKHLVFMCKSIGELGVEIGVDPNTIADYAHLHGLCYVRVNRYINPDEKAIVSEAMEIVNGKRPEARIEELKEDLGERLGEHRERAFREFHAYIDDKKAMRIKWLVKDLDDEGIKCNARTVNMIKEYFKCHGYVRDTSRSSSVSALFEYPGMTGIQVLNKKNQ